MTDPPDIDDTIDCNDSAAMGRGRTASRRGPGARFAPGDLVARRYRIESYLAAGGMGEVYRAQDLTLDVPLALKTIRPEIASDPAALRRFKQEVLLARSVSHPNVCRIFDIGLDETTGVSFLTMEFLPGETLASRIESSGAFSAEWALPIVRQLAEALDAAHRAGIVHRDFKSPNVMLVPTAEGGDRASITDFGLALAVDNGRRVTHRGERVEATDGATTPARTADDETLPPSDRERPRGGQDGQGKQGGGIVGTPAYMSPEQVTGGRVGPASDLYALGVVLFEMSTGRLPFRGATPIETARAHVTTPPPKPSTLAAIDRQWDEAILRLLSKDPADRYLTARDAVLALEGRADGKRGARHSLPAERNAFVGRAAELDAMASHLEGSDGAIATRLLTLQGPGGTGKTRLTQKYGWERLAHWPGGVWFCDLSEVCSVDGIAQAVATALDVPLGKGDSIVQLGNAIAGRDRCLLILDNFEQVVEHAETTLGRWLERATEASFLVTTRERLGLPEETTHALEPLDPATEGVELFEVRAQAHRPGFAVDDDNRQQVEQIVAELDGLPLAIELAAARLRMLALDQLAERLSDRFRVLAGGKRGRHATLSATLDWSWELLAPWERSAITQASVFEGGFTLEAAEAVIDLEAHAGAPFVLDVIQALVDKSWLRTGVALGAPRFAMYATVQEYASARLRAFQATAETDSSCPVSPEAAEGRHGAYFAAMGTEEAIEQLDRHGGVALRVALRLELDNLVAACRRAMARHDEEVTVATYTAADAVIALQGPFAASIRLGLEALGILNDATRRGRALLALAAAERLAGMTEESRTHNEAGLAIHREVGDRRSEGVVLGNLGSLHQEQWRMEEALAHHEAALAIHREVGNRHGEGKVLGNLGNLYMVQRRMAEAGAHYEAGLAIHREVGDRRGEGIVLGNLAGLHMDQGRMEEARKHYEAALAIDREVGNRRFEGSVLCNLGILHKVQGRMEEAREHYEAALAIDREVGNRRFEGTVLCNLGVLHNEQGRMEEAREHYEAAVAIHRELGNRRGEGIVLGNLGILHAEQGRMKEACECFDDGEASLRAVDALALGKLLCARAEMERATGAMESARGTLREVEALVTQVQAGPDSELGREVAKLRQAFDGVG